MNQSKRKVEMRYRFVAVIVGLALPAVLVAGIAQPQGLEDPIDVPVVEAKHAGLIDPMTMGTACLRERAHEDRPADLTPRVASRADVSTPVAAPRPRIER